MILFYKAINSYSNVQWRAISPHLKRRAEHSPSLIEYIEDSSITGAIFLKLRDNIILRN